MLLIFALFSGKKASRVFCQEPAFLKSLIGYLMSGQGTGPPAFAVVFVVSDWRADPAPFYKKEPGFLTFPAVTTPTIAMPGKFCLHECSYWSCLGC